MRYRILTVALLPLALAWMWWRGRREPAWRRDWRQRLGHWPERTDRPLWVHVASVGEANAAAPLLRELAAREWPLQLSAFTPSGVAQLRQILPQAQVALLPLDLRGAMQRVLQRVAPRALLILETELWPNCLLACVQAQVPVMWLSARISERSLRGYQRIMGPRLIARSMAAVRMLGAQSSDDARRFQALGLAAACCQVTGNLKSDFRLSASLLPTGQQLRTAWGRSCVWLAASTHPGEEATVLAAHKALRLRVPDALLLLAPRHPRRTGEVIELLQGQGVAFSRHSAGAPPAFTDAVYLIDTLGELPQFYAACDFCFVGGSLVPIGGHNLLEPAALGRAIVTGPHLQSCADTAAALQAAGALQVLAQPEELTVAISMLAAEPERAKTRGRAGVAYVSEQQGALARSLSLLDAVLASAADSA